MNENLKGNFKLRLSSMISGSFSDISLPSPSFHSDGETEIVAVPTFAQRSSVGSPVGSPASPFSSAHGVDIMTTSIDAQRGSIISHRQNWLLPLKTALDATGTLSDVTRFHRLSRLLEVATETLSIEEELKNYLASVANQKLTNDLMMHMNTILKESKAIQGNSERKPEDNLDRKLVEEVIYYFHEPMERILRSLLFIVMTFNCGGSNLDDAAFQFDRLRPTIMNQSAVETLIMALPQKYSLEIIRMP